MGEQPRRREIALLAEVGPQDADIEVLRLYPAQPVIQRADRRVNWDRLVVVGRRPRRDRPGIGAILPEKRAQPAPVAARQPLGVAAEQMLNAVLVAPAAGRSTIFDAASGDRQDADPQREIARAAQTDCRYLIAFSRPRAFSKRFATSVQFTTFHHAVT